jgi:hypothetical protein
MVGKGNNGAGGDCGAQCGYGLGCGAYSQLKWLVKVIIVQVEIVVLNMVMDLVVEHIVIDYMGHWHCLLVLFMDLSKR